MQNMSKYTCDLFKCFNGDFFLSTSPEIAAGMFAYRRLDVEHNFGKPDKHAC